MTKQFKSQSLLVRDTVAIVEGDYAGLIGTVERLELGRGEWAAVRLDETAAVVEVPRSHVIKISVVVKPPVSV